MLDPDAPSRSNPITADWLHMGLMNVKGEDLVKGIDFNRKNKSIENNIFMSKLRNKMIKYM